MAAGGDDLAAVHHDNPVGVLDRVQSVGDHEHRALVHQRFDGLLNQVFALGIDLAGGFVEDQDRACPREDGAGDVEPLLLTAG